MCADAPKPYPEPSGIARGAQRAVSDETRTEQGRGLCVVVVVGDRDRKALVGDRELRVAARQGVAREARKGAQIFLPAQAELADPARPAEPRHSDPRADLEAPGTRTAVDHRGHDLMAEHQWQCRIRQLTVEHVQVRATDTARVHSGDNLSGTRMRLLDVGEPQRMLRSVQKHGAHVNPDRSWRDRPRLADGRRVAGGGRVRRLMLDASRPPWRPRPTWRRTHRDSPGGRRPLLWLVHG